MKRGFDTSLILMKIFIFSCLLSSISAMRHSTHFAKNRKSLFSINHFLNISLLFALCCSLLAVCQLWLVLETISLIEPIISICDLFHLAYNNAQSHDLKNHRYIEETHEFNYHISINICNMLLMFLSCINVKAISSIKEIKFKIQFPRIL